MMKSIPVLSNPVRAIEEEKGDGAGVIFSEVPQPVWTQANRERKEVKWMKTRKKVILSADARRQEAKFWEMMRAADPGKRCLK